MRLDVGVLGIVFVIVAVGYFFLVGNVFVVVGVCWLR